MKISLPVALALGFVACAIALGGDVRADAPHDTYGSSLGAPLAELNSLTGNANELLSVNPQNGAPTSTIPFELVRARGGAQPALALHYFPGEDGEAGHGWTLQMPTIERKPLWGLPHYNADPLPATAVTALTDRFVFAGQPLVPICKITNGLCPQLPSEPFGAALEGWNYFRLAVDSSFARFFWSADLRTWRVQDPSGVVAEYGVPSTEPTYVDGVDAQGGFAPFRWNLVRQWDAQGATANAIIYRWGHIGALGRGYLTDIFDTAVGNSDRTLDDFTTYAHHTQLHYEHQPYSVLNGGNPIFGQHDMRLTHVDVTSKDWAATQPRALVRSYQLTYFNEDGAAAFFNSSYLTSVTHFGSVPTCQEDPNFSLPNLCGARALPPFTIGYEGINVGARCGGNAYAGIPDANELLVTTAPKVTWPTTSNSITIIDGNQDGIPDFYVAADGSAPALSLANQLPAALSEFAAVQSGVSGSHINSQQLLSDRNFTVIGDWGFDGAQLLSGFCNTAGGASCSGTSVNSYLLFDSKPPQSSSFFWQEIGLFNQSLPLGQAFADINHDGLIDEFQIGEGSSSCIGSLSTRDSATGRVMPFNVPSVCDGQLNSALADMDGDGLPDQIPIGQVDLHKVSSGHYSLQVTYGVGNGIGTFPTQRQMALVQFEMDHPANSIQQPTVQFHDLNADGLADVLVFGMFNGNEGVAVFFNKDGVNLYGVTPNKVAGTGLTNKVRKAFYGDIDGDGLDDLVMYDGANFSSTGKQRCGRLVTVANGNGATATAHYDQSVRLQQNGLMTGSAPVAMDVVAGIDVVAPGAPFDSTTRAYFYDDPVYDYWKHQFRGFRHVRVRTATNETFSDAQHKRQAAVHHTQVSTTYEITGCSAVDDTKGVCNPDLAALRQLGELPVVIDVFGDAASQSSLTDPPPTTSTYYSTTVNEYVYQDYVTGLDGRTVRLLTPRRVDTYLYDDAPFVGGQATQVSTPDILCGAIDVTGGGTTLAPCSSTSVTVASPNHAHLRRDRTADVFGNLIQDTDYGRITDANAPIDTPVTTQFVPKQVGLAEDLWIWRRNSVKVAGFGVVDGAQDYDRNFSYQWDSHGNLLHVFGTLVGSAALQRTHENGGLFASPPTTQSQDGVIDLADLTYDQKGNVKRAIAPNNRCTDYAYDQQYDQLPTATTVYSSGCGQDGVVTSQMFVRQFAVPNMAMDATGAVATVDFDDLGRPTGAHQPDPLTGMMQTASSVAISYSDAQNGSFHWVHIVAANSERYVYLDALDQVAFVLDRADVSAGDVAPWIASGYHRINDKQDTLSYQPEAFSGAFPDLIVSPSQIISTSKRKVTHDEYGRATAGFDIDGTKVGTLAYHALSVDSTSEGGNLSTVDRDGHGQVIKTHRFTGTDDLQLAFEYSATGEVVAASQAHGANPAERVVRQLQRDSFGRVVVNVEPNTGAFSPRQTHYAYDDAGDLVGTNDARGCGENLTYDGAGRLTSEDYSPCLDSQPVYTMPAGSSGFGTEAFYGYDAFGRLSVTFDRGAADLYSYDSRSRATSVRRLVAKPGDPSPDIVQRYTTHPFESGGEFDDSNRVTSVATGADVPELLVNGVSKVHFNYSARNVIRSIDGSYGTLLSAMTYEVDGLPTQVSYGDVAQTTTSYFYDARRRPASTTTQRPPVNCPSSTWGCANGSYLPPAASPSTLQSSLESSTFDYDNDGNLRVVDDLRPAEEWPDGAKPVTRTMYHDSVRRLTRIDYNVHSKKGDTQVSPFGAEEQALDATPLPSQTLPLRVEQQRFDYDWHDNLITSTDDTTAGFFDRSLGTPHFAGVGPHQMTSASGTNGSLNAQYDDAGNLVNLVLIRNAVTCSAPTQKCVQRFVYDWDEVGNMRRARRWDYSTLPTNDPPYPDVPTDIPAADLTDSYHQGVRILKASANPTGDPTFTVNIFGSLRLDHTTYDSVSNDYIRDANTESAYLAGVAHLVYDAADPSTTSGGHQYVLYELGDSVGSTSTVFDRDTSELVEHVTYQAYGATDSDYRTDRWASFREHQRLSGNDDDIEVGLVYFGARYYSPNLQQWMSPDPATIHAMASSFNPYAYVGHSPTQAVDFFGLQAGCDNLSPGCNPVDAGGGSQIGGTGGGGGTAPVCVSEPDGSCGNLLGHGSGGGVGYVDPDTKPSTRSAPPPPPADPSGTGNAQSPSNAWSFFGAYGRAFVRNGASTVFSGFFPTAALAGPITGHLLVQSGAIPSTSACVSWTCQQVHGAFNALKTIGAAFDPPGPNASSAANTGNTLGAIHGVASGIVGVTAASAGIGDLFIALDELPSIGAAATDLGATSLSARELNIGTHALRQMAERGITKGMVRVALEKGTPFIDPKNGTVNYVLRGGFASGKDLLVGTNPLTGKITTTYPGWNLIRPRFLPLAAPAKPPIILGP